MAKTGVNTSTIINFRKEIRADRRTGNAVCSKCKWLRYGYYCERKRMSAPIGNGKLRIHCQSYKLKKNSIMLRMI